MMKNTTRMIPYDSRKTSSSERGTINVMTVVKDVTETATTLSYRRDRPPSCCLTSKKASPYWYI